MPVHPPYHRREVYGRFGTYHNKMRITVDYDSILQYLFQVKGKLVYTPEEFYKMGVGGISRRNWAKIHQSREKDMLEIRRNRVGGIHTLAFKNHSKVGQFLVRPQRS